METQHDHFEWASQNGLDLDKVTADWPEIPDREKLARWVDGEGNMLVLCAVHHRGQHTGIGMRSSYPAWLLHSATSGDQFTFIVQPSVRAHTPLFSAAP